MARPKKSDTPIRTPKILDEKYLGKEPNPESVFQSEMDLIKAFNYYNYFNDQKKSVEYLHTYLKTNNLTSYQQIKKIETYKLPTTLGWIARMLSRKCELPESTISWFDKTILSFIESVPETKKKKEKVESKYPSYWYIAELDEIIDKFVFNNYESDFNFSEWAKINTLPMNALSNISIHYTPLVNELKEAVSGKDKQLKEAYTSLSKKELKSFIDFMNSFVIEASSIISNRKRTKAPRKKRQPKIENVIKGLKYQSMDNTLNISSLSPAKILDATQLITFNTKTRKLSHYFAEDTKKFGIVGSTLQNVDFKKSVEKTLRKPHDILPLVLKASRREIPKIMNKLTTVQNNIDTGRINKNHVLLMTFN